MNLLLRHVLLSPSFDVSPCSRIAAHAHHGNDQQGVVCSAVAVPVQAMSDRFARRRLQWACVLERCECSFTFQAFGINARNSNKHCRCLRLGAKSLWKPAGMLEG